VVNNNGGGNQSKRGFDRVYGGQQTEQARELWTFRKTTLRALPRRWVRSASGSRCECVSGRARAGLAANRPVVIDVVTDIDALAPVAVA